MRSHGTTKDTSRQKRQQEQGSNVMHLSRHTARRPQLRMWPRGCHCRSGRPVPWVAQLAVVCAGLCGPQLLDRIQTRIDRIQTRIKTAAHCSPVCAPQLLHGECHIFEHLLAFGWLCVGLTKANQGRQQLARVQHRTCRTRPRRNQGITPTCHTTSQDDRRGHECEKLLLPAPQHVHIFAHAALQSTSCCPQQ